VKQLCQVSLRSEDEETEDPKEADQQIEQAFVQVRAVMRREDDAGIWTKHNAEYGFARNLLGSRFIWLTLSLLGTAACALAWYLTGDNAAIATTVLDCLSLLCAFLGGWYLLPTLAKEAADRYAEGIWNSFLTIANKDQEDTNAYQADSQGDSK